MFKCSTRSLLAGGVVVLSLGAGPALSDAEVCVFPPPAVAVDGPRALNKEGHEAHVDVLPPLDPRPADPIAPPPADADAPLIQVALLLDTSNSMDGLIDQAKAQLWMITNRFAKAQRDGRRPNFQIAVYEYGNTNLSAEEGYIRQVTGFTNDLDAVSEALFSLTTRGGSEYCGQVIDEALTRLAWSPNANDFKAIYIAGNEAFTQGAVHYVGVCKRAHDKGVLVNTIHCGDEQEGIRGKWQHGAQIAGGSFLTINQDRAFVREQVPQDAELLKLNAELNKTYLAYGAQGQQAAQRQEKVDADNAALSPDAAAERAATKAGAFYDNSGWDLVDASKQADFALGDVPADQLPEAMREMTQEQRRAYVLEMAKKRAELQRRITEVAAARDKAVAEDRARRADAEGDSLGEAVEGTVDDQLKEAGFEVEKQDEAKQDSPQDSSPPQEAPAPTEPAKQAE